MPAGYIIIFIRTNCRAKQRHICTRGLQQPLIIRDFNCGVPSLLSWQPGTDFFWLGNCQIVQERFFFFVVVVQRRTGFKMFECFVARREMLDQDGRGERALGLRSVLDQLTPSPCSPWMIPLFSCFRLSLYFKRVSDIRDHLSFLLNSV